MFLFVSCKHDIGKLPKPISGNSNTVVISECGDLSVVSYSTQIQPIINLKCVSCHDASTGIKLYNYPNLVLYANSGQLVGCLNGNGSYLQMPPTGSLDSCTIKIIASWVQQGKLNN